MPQTLEFSEISKVFPGVRALDNVSLRAEGGRVLAMIGENGAGKSTLLKIIAGDLRTDNAVTGYEVFIVDIIFSDRVSEGYFYIEQV